MKERADGIVRVELDKRLKKFEKEISGDALAYLGPINYGADDEIRKALETRRSNSNRTGKGPKLAVILETEGGYAEVAERIADVFRAHYERVDFFVPGHAFSAGTILVMSGDAIYMDYYSVLGPIDPQVKRDERWVPVLGYLDQYKKLIGKSKRGTLTTAELMFMLDKFDPGEIHAFEQQKELSITLLKKWLANYKFKNWDKTATRGKNVTPTLRTKRAAEIARTLQDTKKWHVHGRGLSMDVLTKEVNLLIDDFGADPKLNASLRGYHRLLKDYTHTIGHYSALHVPGQYVPLSST